MSARSGFTLVEVVVASVASTILAAALFSLLHFNGAQMVEGSRRNTLAHRHGIVLEEMQRVARRADFVTSNDTGINLVNPRTDNAVDSVGPNPRSGLAGVVLRRRPPGEAAGSPGAVTVVGGFRNDPVPHTSYAILQEWVGGNAGGWQNFRIGNDIVYVLPNPFAIIPGRRGISFTLNLVMVEDGAVTEQLITASEVIRCRNGYYWW